MDEQSRRVRRAWQTSLILFLFGIGVARLLDPAHPTLSIVVGVVPAIVLLVASVALIVWTVRRA